MIFLALLLLNGQSVAPPAPWDLTVAIEREAGTVWLSHRYGSQIDCMDGLIMVATAVPTEGRLVSAYCEPAPRTV